MSYKNAHEQVWPLCKEVIQAYHPDLVKASIAIDILFKYAAEDKDGEPRGAALKLHGRPCAAIVRIIAVKDRTLGRGDAEIIIDGDTWEDRPLEEQRALLDHELTHLMVVKDDSDRIETDDANRPKLKMREHDVEIGWFNCIAERHGPNSIEIQQATRLNKMHGQLYFGFIPEPAAEKPSKKKAAA